MRKLAGTTARLIISFAYLLICMCGSTYAQNGTPCYTPIAGLGTTATPVASGGYCLGCNTFTNISNLTDADKNNAASANGMLGLQASEGISVRDSIRTWPAGYMAGYVIALGNDALTANVLQNFVIETYSDGQLQETRTVASGLTVAVLAANPGKLYVNFKTVAAFNEVRLVLANAISALHSLSVYYAMAFDPACGIPDTDNLCYDPVAGMRTQVLFNGGLLQAGTSLKNPNHITDGNKHSYATFTGLTNLSLLSTPVYVGVKDLEVVYPGGRKAGFVIGAAQGLLSADVLHHMSVETYLHGQLQEIWNQDAANGLITASVLNSQADGQIELSFRTDPLKPFNEVRLVIQPSGNLSVALGDIRVYYAFESDANCGNCSIALTTGQPDPYKGQLVARDRNPALLATYNTTGTYGITLASLTNVASVVSDNLNDYATFNAVLGVLGSGVRVTVKNTNGADLPANSIAGFAIANGSGLLQAAVLPAITIRLYNNNSQKPVQTISGASLLNLGLLTGNNGPVFVGGRATVPFDEMELDINQGLLSAGLQSTFRIYYAYVIRDDDHDGVADCMEVCGNANDAMDRDGDGTPDGCDACNALNTKSGFRDTDSDGVPDACDADSDNDGIADSAEDRNQDGDPTNDDADGDGIPNYLDLDSDNDGIPDMYESGISAAVLHELDADADGVIDATVAKGSNGMANAIEQADNSGTAGNYMVADTDGDGVPDFTDLDSDNDGINDILEYGRAGLIDTNGDGMADIGDVDGDGLMNSADGKAGRGGAAFRPLDTDGDGAPNFRDLDSDNDGLNDIAEYGAPGISDVNGDGMVDGSDTDADGIMDSADGNTTAYGDASHVRPVDTDADGVPDMLDLDSDNDSVSDLLEGANANAVDADNNGVIDGPDTDGDGIMDAVDGMPHAFGDTGDAAPFDSDQDNMPDYRDPDRDNDGVFDIIENGMGRLDKDRNGQIDQVVDPDKDGIANNGGLDFEPEHFGGVGKVTVLSVKALLQGALAGTTGTIMRDDLRQQGYVPLQQPYSATLGTRFAHVGGGAEQTTAEVLNAPGNDAVVDWVFIELRSDSDSTIVTHTFAALIQKDGDIADTDGNTIMGISLPAGSYFISLKHRNHLGVMTSRPVIRAGSDTLIDFTTMSDADVYNRSIEYEGLEQVVINGKKALWAGNGNADQAVKYDGADNDRMAIAADVLQFPGNINLSLNYSLAYGYYAGDLNMNGNVKHEGANNDRAFLANIVLGYPLNTSRDLAFALLIEQIP